MHTLIFKAVNILKASINEYVEAIFEDDCQEVKKWRKDDGTAYKRLNYLIILVLVCMLFQAEIPDSAIWHNP